MKMRKMREDNDSSERMFIAYYNDEAYGVSEDKKLLKIYMERYRKLKPSEYIIMEDSIDDVEMLKYDDLVLCEFEGLYIPARDITLIGVYTDTIPERITNLCKELYYFGGLIGQFKDANKDINLIIKTYEMLSKYYTGEKKLKRMRQIDHLENPILYCEIYEYKRYLSQYQEMKDMNRAVFEKDWNDKYLDRIWDDI